MLCFIGSFWVPFSAQQAQHKECICGKLVCFYHLFRCVIQVMGSGSRDYFVYAPSQWETTLQCNIASHWLDAYTKWCLGTLTQGTTFSGISWICGTKAFFSCDSWGWGSNEYSKGLYVCWSVMENFDLDILRVERVDPIKIFNEFIQR